MKHLRGIQYVMLSSAASYCMSEFLNFTNLLKFITFSVIAASLFCLLSQTKTKNFVVSTCVISNLSFNWNLAWVIGGLPCSAYFNRASAIEYKIEDLDRRKFFHLDMQ